MLQTNSSELLALKKERDELKVENAKLLAENDSMAEKLAIIDRLA